MQRASRETIESLNLPGSSKDLLEDLMHIPLYVEKKIRDADFHGPAEYIEVPADLNILYTVLHENISKNINDIAAEVQRRMFPR